MSLGILYSVFTFACSHLEAIGSQLRKGLQLPAQLSLRASPPKLVEDERRCDFACAFFVIGDDAAHEVGIGVPQRRHQARELLFVELTHRAEHTLARASTELTLVSRAGAHAW